MRLAETDHIAWVDANRSTEYGPSDVATSNATFATHSLGESD